MLYILKDPWPVAKFHMMTSFSYSQAKMSPVCKIEHCFVTAVTGSYVYVT